MLLRIICTIMILIAEATHNFHEEWSNWVYTLTTLVINVSQVWALYVLAVFYVELKKELAPLAPLGKFVVVKAVVFFSFWQSVAITTAGSLGWIPRAEGYTEALVAKGIQDFAICVEMFIAAIAFTAYYSYRDVLPKEDGGPSAMALMQQQDAQFDREQEEEAAAVAALKADAIAVSLSAIGGGGGFAVAASSRALTRPATGAGLPGIAEDGGAPPAAGGGGGGGGSGGGGSEGDRTPSTLQPLGVGAALRDMLPGDVVAETVENFATGFGLKHKYEKRAAQRLAAVHDEGSKAWARIAAGEAGPGTDAGGGDAGRPSSSLPPSTPRAGGGGAGGGHELLSARTKKRSERVLIMSPPPIPTAGAPTAGASTPGAGKG